MRRSVTLDASIALMARIDAPVIEPPDPGVPSIPSTVKRPEVFWSAIPLASRSPRADTLRNTTSRFAPSIVTAGASTLATDEAPLTRSFVVVATAIPAPEVVETVTSRSVTVA
jgi:hypothetical protein